MGLAAQEFWMGLVMFGNVLYRSGNIWDWFVNIWDGFGNVWVVIHIVSYGTL